MKCTFTKLRKCIIYKPLTRTASQPINPQAIDTYMYVYYNHKNRSTLEMCCIPGKHTYIHMTEILVLTNYFVVVMIIIESCVPQEVGVFLLVEACMYMDSNAKKKNIKPTIQLQNIHI